MEVVVGVGWGMGGERVRKASVTYKTLVMVSRS